MTSPGKYASACSFCVLKLIDPLVVRLIYLQVDVEVEANKQSLLTTNTLILILIKEISRQFIDHEMRIIT